MNKNQIFAAIAAVVYVVAVVGMVRREQRNDQRLWEVFVIAHAINDRHNRRWYRRIYKAFCNSRYGAMVRRA